MIERISNSRRLTTACLLGLLAVVGAGGCANETEDPNSIETLEKKVFEAQAAYEALPKEPETDEDKQRLESAKANIDKVKKSYVDRREADSRFRRQLLIGSLTVFVLAVFVGFEVITKVPPTLHTPLMSGSNAISGITIVGALLASGAGSMGFAAILGLLAVIFAAVNVVGGFLVTHRMLAMFQKKK